MQLHSILYSSAETEPLTEQDLKQLLEQASCYNARHQVTGMLLYYKHSFMQLLEGDKDVIQNLFNKKIFLDHRHTAVTVYFDKPIQERTFPSWSMGFKIIEHEEIKKHPAYTPFLERGFNSDLLKHDSTAAKQILLMFSGRIPPI